MPAFDVIALLARPDAALILALTWLPVGQAAHADEDASVTTNDSLLNPVPGDGLRPFCTDRPTKGTGPCTVDAGHLQIESDILNATIQDDAGMETDTYLYTSPNFRLGITDAIDAEL